MPSEQVATAERATLVAWLELRVTSAMIFVPADRLVPKVAAGLPAAVVPEAD